MKKYLISVSLLLAFSACGHKNAGADLKDSVLQFSPPVAKPDEETLEKSESNQLYTVAEDAPKPEMAADIRIDKSVGNAYMKAKDDDVGAVNDTSKKIIKNGDIEFETGNLVATRKRILHSLKKYGGYISEDNQSVNSDENRKEYVLKIKIPAKYFDFLLDSVSSTADKIDSKNISISDITTRYIDVKTRLDNKKKLEARYLELLKKASRIPDLLEIENKLTEIRSDIESTQGQLNYMNKQVAYSSLDITFYTKHIDKVDKGVGFGYKLKTSVLRGVDFLQNLFFGLIAKWPLIAGAIIIYGLFKSWRKRKKAKEAA